MTNETSHGSDFPMSAERGCGASGKEGARDTPGQPARETWAPETVPLEVYEEALAVIARLRGDWREERWEMRQKLRRLGQAAAAMVGADTFDERRTIVEEVFPEVGLEITYDDPVADFLNLKSWPPKDTP